MRVMVTGAAGFLGRLLVQKLLTQRQLRGRSLEALILLDQQLDGFPTDPQVRLLSGSVTEPSMLRRALADGVDVVFHLAGVPDGTEELDYNLGHRVNLLGSLELLSQLRCSVRAPVLVYASSIAVYGAALPSRADEQCLPQPRSSRGTHDLMVETQLSDLARRGEVDGRALRLPVIVARPRGSNGLWSAFMSDLMHALAAGDAYCCPVSQATTAWWMSARCCVENLLTAAEFKNLGVQRVWQVPVLQLSVGQVVEALAEVVGTECQSLVSYRPDPALEAKFACTSPLRAPQAKALGLRHDGSAQALIRNSLNLTPWRSRAISQLV